MVTVKFRRAVDDPEKAVLPCLIFISARHPAYAEHRCSGFSIAIGWWDWSVQLSFIAPTTGDKG